MNTPDWKGIACRLATFVKLHPVLRSFEKESALQEYTMVAEAELHAEAHDRAEALLAVHGGNCCVKEDSDLGRAFREMEKAGYVECFHTSVPGQIQIRRK